MERTWFLTNFLKMIRWKLKGSYRRKLTEMPIKIPYGADIIFPSP